MTARVGLVRVRGRGHPAAQIDELADPLIRGPVDRPGEEPPVRLHEVAHSGVDRYELLPDFPVDGEMVLAAEQVVVDPGDGRRCGSNPCTRIM